MIQIPENDWKKLRSIRENALNRFCKTTLSRISALSKSKKADTEPHALYLEIYKYIHSQDKRLSELFDDWRRSTANLIVAGWAHDGIITEAEFDTLSEETKNFLKNFGTIRFYSE